MNFLILITLSVILIIVIAALRPIFIRQERWKKLLALARPLGMKWSIENYLKNRNEFAPTELPTIYFYNFKSLPPSILDNIRDLENKESSLDFIRACKALKILVYWAQGEYQKFLDLVERVNVYKHEPFLYQIAFAYFNLNNFSAAIKILQDIELENLVNSPFFKDFFVQNRILLIECFLSMEQAHLALTTANEVLRKRTLGSKDVRLKLRKLLGDVYYQLGERNKCLKEYRKVLTKDYNWSDIDGQLLRDKIKAIEAESEGNRSRYIPSQIRKRVWQRDKGKCNNCGSTENLHFDHIIPFSKGGANTVDNVQVLCSSCNLSKSDKVE